MSESSPIDALRLSLEATTDTLTAGEPCLVVIRAERASNGSEAPLRVHRAGFELGADLALDLRWSETGPPLPLGGALGIEPTTDDDDVVELAPGGSLETRVDISGLLMGLMLKDGQEVSLSAAYWPDRTLARAEARPLPDNATGAVRSAPLVLTYRRE